MKNEITVTLQLPAHTVEFYRQFYSDYTVGMRKVLEHKEAQVSPRRYSSQVKCNVI